VSARNIEERLCDAALIRCRKAFQQGKLPSSDTDLALAKESIHATGEELEYIGGLIGEEIDFDIH